jgi:hypothetical protein
MTLFIFIGDGAESESGWVVTWLGGLSDWVVEGLLKGWVVE